MAPIRCQVVSAVRSAASRNRCLSLAKTCSIGFRSGLYGGRNSKWAPAFRMAFLTVALYASGEGRRVCSCGSVSVMALMKREAAVVGYTA